MMDLLPARKSPFSAPSTKLQPIANLQIRPGRPRKPCPAARENHRQAMEIDLHGISPQPPLTHQPQAFFPRERCSDDTSPAPCESKPRLVPSTHVFHKPPLLYIQQGRRCSPVCNRWKRADVFDDSGSHYINLALRSLGSSASRAGLFFPRKSGYNTKTPVQKMSIPGNIAIPTD